MIGKVRPQIFLAIIVLGLLSGVGLYYGMNEIATGCTGGIIALGMKVLESEQENKMIKAIRAAMKYSDALPLAIDLIEEIQRSIRDDGSISKEERSKLLKRFWALVKVFQDPKKS